MNKLCARLWFPLVLTVGWTACGNDPEPDPLPLEVGYRGADDQFVPLGDGDAMAVVLGPNGLNMIVPSLRMTDVDPKGPDSNVEVLVEGLVMAADIEGSSVDMQPDGSSYILWDLRVPFQNNLCCYNCAVGKVTATLKDASGQPFIGEVSIVLGRSTCPDPAVCCSLDSEGIAAECPLASQSVVNVCEE